jgi:hypothetical protein
VFEVISDPAIFHGARVMPALADTIGHEHVIMVLDQAGWHGSGHLRVPDNIMLVLLPLYSPELNRSNTCGSILGSAYNMTTMRSSRPPATG